MDSVIQPLNNRGQRIKRCKANQFTQKYLYNRPISIFLNSSSHNRPQYEALENKPHKLCNHSSEPRTEVYCFMLYFSTLKLVYFGSYSFCKSMFTPYPLTAFVFLIFHYLDNGVMTTLKLRFLSFLFAPGGGGVLREKLGMGVRSACQNTYPIYDQNLRFSLPYL